VLVAVFPPNPDELEDPNGLDALLELPNAEVEGVEPKLVPPPPKFEEDPPKADDPVFEDPKPDPADPPKGLDDAG